MMAMMAMMAMTAMTAMTTMASTRPEGLLLAYYGDDFTGSTDALEALTAAGLKTLLCIEPPTFELLQRFPDLACMGLAGSSRGRSPEWMDTALPAAFASLAVLGAPILHYKVCSTFDSSPTMGSIGHAIDIGTRTMGASTWSPIVVGTPRLKRWQAFGNLYAGVGDEVFRLDRHPTMSRHPTTPMHESDLRVHLSRQTARRLALIDLVQMKSGRAEVQLDSIEGDDVPATFIDVVDEQTLLEAGRLVWERRAQGLFSASSSGLCYALVAYWRSLGWLPVAAGLPKAGAVDAIAAVSGSCSPVTAAQLQWARTNGFVTERLRVDAALDDRRRDGEVERCVSMAARAIASGQSVIVFSAEGPDDPTVVGFDGMAADAGLARQVAARRIGTALADVMRLLLDRVSLRRVVVAGGDSSGEVAGVLAIEALQAVATMAPGAPLCRAVSNHPGRDGLELVLKGGQMGHVTFFGDVRNGTPAQA